MSDAIVKKLLEQAHYVSEVSKMVRLYVNARDAVMRACKLAGVSPDTAAHGAIGFFAGLYVMNTYGTADDPKADPTPDQGKAQFLQACETVYNLLALYQVDAIAMVQQAREDKKNANDN